MSSSGQLFDPEPFRTDDENESSSSSLPSSSQPIGGLAVRVMPDVSGFDKEFDYVVPRDLVSPTGAGTGPPIAVGSLVRIELKGRAVDGWITGVDIEPPAGVTLSPVVKVLSVGPTADVVEVARWAAHRWSGRTTSLLKTASPPRFVRSLPASDPDSGSRPEPTAGVRALRVSPTDRIAEVVAPLVDGRDAIVIVPRIGDAAALAGDLRRAGVTTRFHPRDWPAAAGRGGVVVGPRSAVWARLPNLGVIVVVDEHDDALQDERNPMWHARDVAVERAARAGVECVLVSPCPSLAGLAVAGGRVATPARSSERAGWPVVEVVDRRNDEPGRTGLFSARMADLVRADGRVLAVLNRKGRATMLACTLCGAIVTTEDGEHLMVETDGRLVAPRTGEERPTVCTNCGATALKRLRLGVTRAAEELAALAGQPVDELTAGTKLERDEQRSLTRIVVGTEAALHQLGHADTVVFLDFDQELLAPRYRAAEQALSLLVLAARLVGPRSTGGRIIVQTRLPDHRVLRAAVAADPGIVAAGERPVRERLGWPPYGALAEVAGAAAAEFVEPLRSDPEIIVLGPRDERYLLRASDPDILADALASAPKPDGRYRVGVDPPRA